ncbi:MAG TPA: XdhC/CoxI family protein [Longimicrobiales bacterium]|jgi:xanthine dehydrogenase accessory factor
MKQWLETRQVLDRLAELRREGKKAALATVVRVRGSAYRREGAKLLVAEDGTTTGNVSGGCLEEDVREVALQVLRTGRPQLRHYCSGADEIYAWDLGVGCEGQVEVFVAPASDAWTRERALLQERAPFAVCTIVAEEREPGPEKRLIVTATRCDGGLGSPELDAATADRARELIGGAASGLHEIAGRLVFIDVFVPPPQLVVIGAGEDARPLARLALDMGFRVVVVDRRPGLLTPDRFPSGVRLVQSDATHVQQHLLLDERCYAVVMTHNFADDKEYVRALVRTPVSYIGMLGPRRRTERILGALDAEGPLDTSRIYGPVGLDIGAEGAEQVALSVVGEILAVRSGRRGLSLRERKRPIHV